LWNDDDVLGFVAVPCDCDDDDDDDDDGEDEGDRDIREDGAYSLCEGVFVFFCFNDFSLFLG
jgi:hypothetical protein